MQCVCMCLSAIARGGRHIFTSRCLPRTPGGFVGIFIYFIFFSTPNFSTKTAHTFTYNVQYNAQVLYIYVYRGVIHALVYNTLYYIIIIHRCQWNGENWLLIIIILIYIYMRIKYCVCVSSFHPFCSARHKVKIVVVLLLLLLLLYTISLCMVPLLHLLRRVLK